MARQQKYGSTRHQLEDLHWRGFDQSYCIGRNAYGQFTSAIRVKCSQCEALCINGLPTHETGCPNVQSWEDTDSEE